MRSPPGSADTSARGSAHVPLPQDSSRVIIGLFVLAGIFLCYLIAVPFVAAIVWAFTLAVLFAPLEKRLRNRSRSALVSTVVTMLIAAVAIVTPGVFVAGALADSVREGAIAAIGLFAPDKIAEVSARSPAVGEIMARLSGSLSLAQVLATLASDIQAWTSRAILGSVTFVVTLLLTFYFLFYFLRDGRVIADGIERFLPFERAEFGVLVRHLKTTIIASVWGTAVIASLQGALGGFVFWWLGLPSPVFWGFVMGLLAIVPFLGAFVVWVPAAVILALDGQWVSATILVAWGTLVVGLIDNLIYPILIGRRLAIHTLVSFIAIVGGIVAFGAHGFVLGPLIVATTLGLLEILRTRMDRQFLTPAGDWRGANQQPVAGSDTEEAEG